MSFGIVDIVIIAAIALAAIIGLVRGFAKTLFSLGKRILGLVIDLFLCAPVARVCVKLGFIQNWNIKIVASLSESNEVFSQALTQESIDNLPNALPQKFSVLGPLLQKVLNSAFADIKDTGITLGQAIADTLVYYVVLAVVFIVLLIILSILLRLIFKFLNSMIESMTLVNTIDKILGLVLGLALGIFFVGLAFVVLDLLSTVSEGVNNFMNTYVLVTASPDKFSVTRFIYNNNPVRLLFNLLVKKENIDWSSIQLQ